ncbi:SlyX family protein [Candidatus Njordibacter sp. Uisw_056]|jgi:SlyX protein|uniref:SlyX family protein n=1 Tax=Candidatus Njordibacter sp. Uisw_056 TaxID=3230973 RepID=UPI003D414C9D|tara:strand:- start:24257 stop:24475 length:219 start_codon:yes stop_codon:yes gene_type:complete
MNNASEIVELQQQIAFQEQTIDTLNEVVSKQQKDLTRIDRALELLAQQMANLQQAADAGQGGADANEPPPHY